MADIEIKDHGAAARRRSDIYGLLAAVYGQEITSDLLRQIRSPQFLGPLSILEVEGMNDLMQKPEAELLEDLAVEHTRLFLGPGKHISPHESVHHQREDGQWGKLWGASTVEVKKFIEATGLSYTDDYKGMPDHISVEFEFMQQLILREEQAWMDVVTIKNKERGGLNAPNNFNRAFVVGVYIGYLLFYSFNFCFTRIRKGCCLQAW